MTHNTAENATAGVPVVRGLEWTNGKAVSSIGRYSIQRTDDGYASVWEHEELAHFGFNTDDPFHEAKKTVEADYEQRITAALNPDFLSELDTARAEIERLKSMFTATEKHGSVYAAVERVLDERSAWVARPNHETTLRVALAATIAANDILGDPVGKVADAQCAVTNAEIARDDEQERADRAESALTAAQARIAEQQASLEAIELACLSEDDDSAAINANVFDIVTRARATLSPAVKEPK